MIIVKLMNDWNQWTFVIAKRQQAAKGNGNKYPDYIIT